MNTAAPIDPSCEISSTSHFRADHSDRDPLDGVVGEAPTTPPLPQRLSPAAGIRRPAGQDVASHLGLPGPCPACPAVGVLRPVKVSKLPRFPAINTDLDHADR